MQIEEHIKLDALTTFHVAAKARFFSRASTQEDLNQSLDFAGSKDIFILGGGSNILLTRNFDGLVIRNEIGGIEVTHEDEDHFYV